MQYACLIGKLRYQPSKLAEMKNEAFVELHLQFKVELDGVGGKAAATAAIAAAWREAKYCSSEKLLWKKREKTKIKLFPA